MTENFERFVNEVEDDRPQDHNEAFERGLSILEEDFSAAMMLWGDGFELVPEDEFDVYYGRVLDAVELYITHRTWRSAEDVDLPGIEEMAVMAQICSPDLYDFIPDLISRTIKHADDMKYVEYGIDVLLVTAYLSQIEFHIEAHSDVLCTICNDMRRFCEDSRNRCERLGDVSFDTYSGDRGQAICILYAELFEELFKALTRERTIRSEDQLFAIGFEWKYEAPELSYVKHIDEAYGFTAKALECTPQNLGDMRGARGTAIELFLSEYFGIEIKKTD